MTRIILLTALLIIFCVPAYAVSIGKPSDKSEQAEQPIPVLTAQQIADRLLSTIFSAYQDYSYEGFRALISRDFVPNKIQFLDNTEANFYKGKITQMRYVIEKALFAKDTLGINFTWDKKVIVRNAPEGQIFSGKAAFMYKKSSGEWKLYKIEGDNPF
ncbi:MAG: hypothetical protein PHV55_05425 [Candidatus Omnitrophica bacterium]|nr:hypothetical protein [Candidatus Omnitrophota bacterium]